MHVFFFGNSLKNKSSAKLPCGSWLDTAFSTDINTGARRTVHSNIKQSRAKKTYSLKMELDQIMKSVDDKINSKMDELMELMHQSFASLE